MAQLTRIKTIDEVDVTEYAYLQTLNGSVSPVIRWSENDSLSGNNLPLPDDVDPNYAYIDNEALVEDTATRTTEQWEKIRKCRDVKMSECDEARNYMTWAESDTPWTQQQKDDWRNYRQELLDVPQDIQADIDSETIDSVLDIDLDTYVWPTKPTLP